MTLLESPPVAGDLTEEILTFLETSEACGTGARGRHLYYDNIQEFDGAFPLDELNAAWSGRITLSREEMSDPAKWPEWPIDVAWCNKLPAGLSAKNPNEAWVFHRMRTCSPKEARGRATIITPRMVSSASTFISAGGVRTPVRYFYAHVGGRWTLAHKETRKFKEYGYFDDESLLYDMDMAFTFSLTRRYAWSVCLGFDGPSIRFLTDPVGVREAFRLRDVPPGKERRAALRHWVSAHNRKTRKDDAALAEVRKHLRGATSFTWNGLRCRIEPSLLDQEQAAAP